MPSRVSASTVVRLAMIIALVATLALQLGGSSSSRAQSGGGVRVSYLFGSGSTHGGRPITLRIQLTGPAPAGGAAVVLRSERPDLIPLPATVTVPAGATELTFTSATSPADNDTHVRVSAGYGGRTMGREVQILEPRLRALYLQTVTRAGGQGKLTVCLTGEAPPVGIAVALTGNNQAAFMVPPAITISDGRACQSIAVDAGEVSENTQVLVSARYKGVSLFRDTIVRDLGGPPPATNTTVAATATSTDPPPTATNTAVASTATATSTDVPPTATSTATDVPPAATATSTDVPALSAGCTALNNNALDGTYISNSLSGPTYNANEVITVGASAASGSAATEFNFFFQPTGGSTVADSDSIPGEVNYTVPAAGQATISWVSPGGAAVWAVSCAASSGEAPTATGTAVPPTATDVPATATNTEVPAATATDIPPTVTSTSAPVTLSAACQALNNPALLWDGVYITKGYGNQNFFAGEVITVSAATVSSSAATTMSLSFTPTGGTTASSSSTIPDTLNHTVLASGESSVSWGTDGAGTADWTVSCAAPANGA